MKLTNIFKNSLYTFLYIYYIVISVVSPNGDIKYSIHWAIYLPLTLFIVLFEGRRHLNIYKKMFKRIFDMYTLIGLGAHIILIYSIVIIGLDFNKDPIEQMLPWEAAGLLIVFTTIGDKIQMRLRKDVSYSFKKLNDLKRQEVLVERDNLSIKVKANELIIGDIVLVNKGELISMDGIALNNTVVNNSNITGESKPVEVKNQSQVISGGYNLGNSLRIKVNTLVENSTLSRVINNFMKASSNKPKAQMIADKILLYFVPVVLLTSLLTFIFWLVIGYTTSITLPWVTVHSPIRAAIEVGVGVLVVSCPCSIGLATPLISLVTYEKTLSKGVVINNVSKLEMIHKTKYIVFDKTGTITTEEMEIINEDIDKKYKCIAKALENNINHPIARAFQKLDVEIVKIANIKELDSIGISGIFNNKEYVIKRSKIISEFTTIGLFEDDKEVTTFKLANQVKPNVKNTIERIKKYGIKTVMMTGDSKEISENIASQVGIDIVFHSMTPELKGEEISKLRTHGIVTFVGDGFNDSIASQVSDVSMAFASGSDIVNDVSDFSLVSSDFNVLLKLIKISKMNKRKLLLSLLWAIGFNALMIPIAILFLIQPWMAGLSMSLSSILIVVNALIYRKQLSKV